MRINRQNGIAAAAGAGVAIALIVPLVGLGAPNPGEYEVNDLSMVDGLDGWTADPIHTVGASYDGYTPPGVLDGLGAYELDDSTVRVLANHELGFNRGYPYTVNGSLSLLGARVSYFDVDKATRQVVASGLAYQTVYAADGSTPTGKDFLHGLDGFSRFCSAGLFEAEQFGTGRGLADRIYFTGEEDGGNFNPIGGAEWALDPATGELWAVPALGRGAWENVTVLDTGTTDQVAILLSDDTSPFDADGDNELEAAPLFLYVGDKDPAGDFLARNGLRDGSLHVWVARNGATTPADFNTAGKLKGEWVELDNEQHLSMASENGYDRFGYPTQRNLWTQAEEAGAFGFSRPEDVATNPTNGSEAVLASTGVDTYVNGVDTFGTIYTITTNFRTMKADLTIVYDGDADPARQLRSPDNLDWADDGRLYIQEDKAEDETLDGEPLFGEGAVNGAEAGIVAMNANGAKIERIAVIDRGVALDASLPNPTMAFDVDFGSAGEWESSGILDVSGLFGEKKGELFLFDVQAHGIEDQDSLNPDSRVVDDDLVEGGQLLFLERG